MGPHNHFNLGNPLPRGIEQATVVPLNGTFLLVGGYDSDSPDCNSNPFNGCALDTIYRYEKLDDSWTLLETKLPIAAAKPVAMMVDIDIFTPC